MFKRLNIYSWKKKPLTMSAQCSEEAKTRPDPAILEDLSQQPGL